jgi:hypothetical protein
MTKPENKPAPKMVRKWVPKIATPKERWSEVIEWRSLAMDYKQSARREATRFVKSRINYREDNPIQDFSSLFK